MRVAYPRVGAPAILAALAVGVAGCGGGDDPGASLPTNTVEVREEVGRSVELTPEVALDVFSAYADAYSGGDYRRAAFLWSRGFRQQLCGGVDKTVEAYREAWQAGDRWPFLTTVTGVEEVSAEPAPRARFAVVEVDGSEGSREIGFVREGGRWVIADPYPSAVADRCSSLEQSAP